MEQPLERPLLGLGDGPVVAGWMRSPTAASEYSSSQNLGLADWQLSGSSYFRKGSGRELPLSKFIAVKLPLEFRFPEADLHH